MPTMVRRKQTWQTLGVALTIVLGISGMAYADPMSSATYQVDETFFGSGGELNASSPNYLAKQSAGELGVGSTSGTDYRAEAGFNTDRYPYLEFNVEGDNIDLGTLTPGTATTATAHFSVRSYLSSGYIVLTASEPPRNSTHLLNPLLTAAASNTSQEQFGINLVANTLPTTFGANPGQVPDTTFGFGQAAPGYNTPNLFRYVQFSPIAFSSRSTGETDYTISYLYNVTNATPGGSYHFNHVLVAIATF